MALVNKPDESIFASSAKQGEVDNFPDLLRGWGISFEQTGGIPPMEWFNFLFKRLDEKHTYLMQRGLPEWSATQDYPAGAFVQYQGLSYKALRTNKNVSPSASNSADWQRWGFTLTEIAKASLTQQGIVQLTNALNSDAENLALTAKAGKALAQQTVQAKQEIIRDYIPNTKKSSAVNSTSTDMVATSAAVKTAYDKGVEAKNAADGAQRTANDGVSKADAAQRTANDGVSKANAAQTSANQAKSAADNAQRTASDANNNANTRQLKSELVGEVAFFARTTPPSGWLKANGAAISRTTYAALFAAIGTTFGAGDGRTTFNLPDLRGEFIRGLDDGRNIDNGRGLGSKQGDAIRNISGHFGVRGIYNNNGAPHGTIIVQTNGVITSTSGGDWDAIGRTSGSSKITTVTIDASRSVPTAAENRPRNIALLACIKY